VHIPIDLNTKKGKGLAYVTYASPTDALAAYEALDKRPFQGRLIHILGAVDRRGNTNAEGGDTKRKTVKDERMARKKGLAGKEFNWSMLYMNVRYSSFALKMDPVELMLHRASLE